VFIWIASSLTIRKSKIKIAAKIQYKIWSQKSNTILRALNGAQQLHRTVITPLSFLSFSLLLLLQRFGCQIQLFSCLFCATLLHSSTFHFLLLLCCYCFVIVTFQRWNLSSIPIPIPILLVASTITCTSVLSSTLFFLPRYPLSLSTTGPFLCQGGFHSISILHSTSVMSRFLASYLLLPPFCKQNHPCSSTRSLVSFILFRSSRFSFSHVVLSCLVFLFISPVPTIWALFAWLGLVLHYMAYLCSESPVQWESLYHMYLKYIEYLGL